MVKISQFKYNQLATYYYVEKHEINVFLKWESFINLTS